METKKENMLHKRERLNRQHEILIALIRNQKDLDLMDTDSPILNNSKANNNEHPAKWIERNKRILKKYQSLVRSAITIEALLEAENNGI